MVTFHERRMKEDNKLLGLVPLTLYILSISYCHHALGFFSGLQRMMAHKNDIASGPRKVTASQADQVYSNTWE